MANIDNIIKALELTDRIGESLLPEKFGNQKVEKLNITLFEEMGNNEYLDKIFDNTKKESDDFVLPIFLGIYEGQALKDMLRTENDPEPIEPDKTKNFGALVLFNDKFEIVEDSTYVPASSVILNHISEVDSTVKEVEKSLETAYIKYMNQELSFKEKVQNLNQLVQNYCEYSSDEIYFSEPVSASEITFLHSFYSNDIHSILESAPKDRGNVTRYLEGFKADAQIDLEAEDKSVYAKILNPLNFPDSRWPSNPAFALSMMQQVAVNLAINDTNDVGTVNGPPGTGKTTLLKDIFADMMVKQAEKMAELKSPADIFNKGDHFGWDSEKPDYHIDWSLRDELKGYGIVVASSNNSAVENISKELPETPDLHEDEFTIDYFSEAYSKFNDKPSPEDTWGYFSAAGGNSKNQKKLWAGLDAIITEAKEADDIPDWDETRGRLKDTLREIRNIKAETAKHAQSISEYREINVDDLRAIREHNNSEKDTLIKQLNALNTQIDCMTEEIDKYNKQIENLKQTKKGGILGKLNSANKQADLKIQNNVDEIDGLMQKSKPLKKSRDVIQKQLDQIEEDNKSVDDQLAVSEKIKFKYQQAVAFFEEKEGVKVMDDAFWDLPGDEIQLAKLWFDDDFRKLQARAFVEAMTLRKSAILNVIQTRGTSAIEHVLKQTWPNRNKIKASQQDAVLNHAWEIIQFVIPVISSTFAAFGSFFGVLKNGGIDNLFIDEAGQALPVQALGAFWRSKRVMAVGDPSQIAPVQPVDPTLLEMIRKNFDLDTDIYTEPTASVQKLGDRASQYGARIEEDWIGVPLWVHRRCLDPMFSIANKISYHNKMVQGAGNDRGPSYWFDVQGKASGNSQFVPTQKDALEKAIAERLSIEDKPVSMKDIFVISPFSIVAEKMKQIQKPEGVSQDGYGYWKKNNVGTVHKFQGKEAKVVFFILGADDTMSGSVSWATKEPNLLNVAATRAKKEFYLIGDKKAFGDFPNLDVTADELDKVASPSWQGVERQMMQAMAQDNQANQALQEPQESVETVDSNNPTELVSHEEKILQSDELIIEIEGSFWQKFANKRLYISYEGQEKDAKEFFDFVKKKWTISETNPFTIEQIERALADELKKHM